jgi:hypothetical protein
MTPHPVDGQWLDFYALLDVPVSADEDTIRKRIGKVYSEAAANSDHRDLSRRHYFQALVERVLPQCRRVLLDPEWRAKYDRQHILHSRNDPSAQDYVAFIASMRGGNDFTATDDNVLPQRMQDDIKVARAVVECALQGAELDLLPSKAVSSKEVPAAAEVEAQPVATPQVAAPPISARATGAPTVVARPTASQSTASAAAPEAAAPAPQPQAASQASTAASPAPTPAVEEIRQSGEPARAKVITAEEAAAIRRRRSSNPDAEPFVAAGISDGLATGRRKTRKGPISRVVVGDMGKGVPPGRLISPTSMNLMVAITGVLLTITINRFTTSPAVATNVGRTPIYLAVASEMESAMLQAETSWEKTPEGSRFDLMVQPVSSHEGLRRALGNVGQMPDAWIPSDTLWTDFYNAQAGKNKRETITASQPIAQTPMVLIARSDKAGLLKQRFPNRQITSWEALRQVVPTSAAGHLGLTDPQKAATGAMARFSMAREWGASRGLTAVQAAKNPNFWKWMAAFEDNAPAAASQTGAMVKDLVLGTTGRYWWALAYESDALDWMSQNKPLEIFYLPRTTLADHPFCAIERVGAPLEVAQGRASFEKFLRSTTMQKELLSNGFRPTEVSLTTKTKNNPFLNSSYRSRGARTGNLPRDERPNASGIQTIMSEWGKRYG